MNTTKLTLDEHLDALGQAGVLVKCDKTHGQSHNTASVYGHYGSVRVCLRLFETDTWLYDPRWEER